MRVLLGLLFGLIISVGITAFVGENPLNILMIIFRSALGSWGDFNLTLFYSTSLLFTGLAVSFAFRCGLFNIGAEGQLSMAALALASLSLWASHFQPLLFYPLALLVTLAGGFLWAAIPGWIRAYRGGHEVVVSMMLNFVAAGIVNFFVIGLLKNPESQNPETLPFPESLLIPITQLHFAVACAVAVGVWYILDFSLFGFHMRCVNLNAEASSRQNIDVRKLRFLTMAFSGLLASGVAINEILGYSGKLRLGFSADVGFVGIAVALLAKNHPLAVIPSALLFGVLTKGTGDLDIETDNITRDFTRIMQAAIILSISAFSFFKFAPKGRSQKQDPSDSSRSSDGRGSRD